MHIWQCVIKFLIWIYWDLHQYAVIGEWLTGLWQCWHCGLEIECPVLFCSAKLMCSLLAAQSFFQQQAIKVGHCSLTLGQYDCGTYLCMCTHQPSGRYRQLPSLEGWTGQIWRWLGWTEQTGQWCHCLLLGSMAEIGTNHYYALNIKI